MLEFVTIKHFHLMILHIQLCDYVGQEGVSVSSLRRSASCLC